MALTQVTGPYPIFTDLDGTPLDDGYLYIGEVNQDPETNPVQVYWDANLSIPATQPIRTNSGYAYRNGTPALIYTAGPFSITIRNKREEFVLYSPVGYGFDPGAVSASVVQNDFTGDGVLVSFTLSAAPSTKLATSVYINGVYQEKDSYSILGNILTFSIAPPIGSSIEVMTNQTGVIGSTNASLVTYTAGFAGAVAQTVQTKLEQSVSVKDFGAVGDGVTDDTAAINAAAVYARSVNAMLIINPVPTYYLVSDTIDLTDIQNIDGRGGRIYGTFSGIPAAIIGSTSILAEASIWLEVQNSADKSIVDGTYGIKILGMNSSQCWLYARGFDSGLYFDGATTDTNFVDNRFHIIKLYNNGNQVYFNMAGTSYAVSNQFIGGTWYLGTNQKKAARGTVKLEIAGSAQIGQVLFQDSEIGISAGSVNTDQALLVYSTLNTSSNVSAVFFKNCRLETYSSFSTDPYMVNIPTTTAGRISIDADFLSVSQKRWLVELGTLKPNVFLLNNQSARGPDGNLQGDRVTLAAPFIYQVNNQVYIPGRVIFNNDFSVPASVFSVGVSNRTARAIGDGRLIASSGSAAYGMKYNKPAGQAYFLRLNQSAPIYVICYDAAGNVLSGTAPWYAQMTQGDSAAAAGGVTLYRGVTNWVYIHPDVVSFFIGAAAWPGVSVLPDISFNVQFGDALTPTFNDITATNQISNSISIQSYLPVGAAFDGTASNGWRNTFYLKTTSSASAILGATAVVATSVTGVTSGDTIGIELDTTLGTERQYFHTTVSSVAGSTINLSGALPAAMDSGRTLLFNRYVAR
jgi:hypothetical protein